MLDTFIRYNNLQEVRRIRYVTANAQQRLPEETQLLLWYMYDKMTVEQDYLQIFQLYEHDGVQYIKHHQEQPSWKEECIYLTDSIVNEKVYIIINGDIQTMLLAEDY